MARLTEKDWKKLKKNNPYKGSFPRPIPRWTPGGRKGRATARAWDKLLDERKYAPPEEES